MPKKYGVKIDNKEIEVKDGFVIKEELNETLDSGTIQFLSEDGEANIDPFDSVIFEGTKINRKKMLVDTFNAEINNFKETLETSDYLYTINLFSETKLLERITLPNLAITKRPDDTIVSVFDKIKEYCKRYLPYIKVYNTEYDRRYTYKASLRYDEALETKFAMECPEFVWNTPTLKEVLMDLFSVADCIPVVKDNVLTFFDLTYKGNPIDTTKLTNRTISKTSADYCDSLTLPMKNIISKQPVVVKEHLLPHSQGGEMTSNNAVYITRKPIYKIKKATMYVYFKGTTSESPHTEIQKLFRFDITNRIVEKKNWEILRNERPKYKSDLANNKCAYLYYDRGNNTINNLGISAKVWGQPDAISTYAFMAYEKTFPFDNLSVVDLNHYQVYGFDHPFIELEYETIEETVINVSKGQEIKNKQNALFDSQSANSVDLEHQTLFEYAKANRLSSKIETIEGTYENESDIPQLGDYIDNKILYSREVSYYDDVYIFRGQLCENYILRNYFTGITSKRRSWSIVDTNEAVLRQDYYKFFILFSTDNLKDENHDGMPCYLSNYNREHFENFNFDITQNSIYNVALVDTHDAQNVKRPSGLNNFGINDLMVYEIGNSFVFSTQQNDNYSFGDKITVDVSGETARYLMDPTPYADSNGELNTYHIRFRNKINELKPSNEDWDTVITSLLDSTTFNISNLDLVLSNLRNNPVVDGSIITGYRYFDLNANFVKDNREIIGTSVQFEYLSANKNVIVNEDVSKIFSAGHRTLHTTSDDLGVKVATNYHYKQGETIPVGEEASWRVDATTNYSRGYKYELNYSGVFTQNSAWCIYSKITGKVLFAINGTKAFYGNFFNTRDFNIYNSQIDKIAIGNYSDAQATLDENYSEHEPEIEQIKVLNRTIDIEDTKDFD